jgi:hypothetical protein
MRTLRERVWAAANVQLVVVTLDTDTTVHTLYGQQMGGRKAYNPKNKGKRSYPPMLTFIAETREYLWGELRNGDRPTGQQIGDHIRKMCAALPPCVKQIFGRADAGFYCGEAVEAYEEFDAQFVISARKTARLIEPLCQAEWKPSPKTDAGGECEFRYQPDGWKKAYRFVALRYEKACEEEEPEESEQYQLFETRPYQYRVFVTDLREPISFLVWFYNQRGGAENLIQEANNDAGLAAHPPHRFDVNGKSFPVDDADRVHNSRISEYHFKREFTMKHRKGSQTAATFAPPCLPPIGMPEQALRPRDGLSLRGWSPDAGRRRTSARAFHPSSRRRFERSGRPHMRPGLPRGRPA